MVLDARNEHQTDQEIADFLGVGETTVRNARHDLTGKNRIGAEFATRDDNRSQAEEYIKHHPEASNREIASETPVSRTTAGNIKKELEEESEPSNTDTQTDEGSMD